MKNISKKFLTIITIFTVICSICTISKAVNETVNVDTNLIQPRATEGDADDPYGINPISIDSEAPVTNETIDTSNIQENYFSCTSEDVIIDNVIHGDAFICTSGKVTINGIIAGNLFVFAQDVEISETAQISSSVFSFSNTFTLNGYINQNAYIAANDNFTMGQNADIFLDLFLASDIVNINGCVERNAYLSSNELQIAGNAQILGNLLYSAEKEINIPEGVVNGKVDFSLHDNSQEKMSSATEMTLEIISYIIFVLVIFGIYKLLKLKFVTDTESVAKRFPLCIILGAVGLIVTPIICILLLAIGVISGLSVVLSTTATTLLIILLMLYILLILIAPATTIAMLSNLIANKLKINKVLSSILFVCILSIAYRLLLLVPTFGTIVMFALVIVGMGLWITNILPAKTKVEQKDETKE